MLGIITFCWCSVINVTNAEPRDIVILPEVVNYYNRCIQSMEEKYGWILHSFIVIHVPNLCDIQP